MSALFRKLRNTGLRAPLFWVALSAVFALLGADQNWNWLWGPLVFLFLFFQTKPPGRNMVFGILATVALFFLLHKFRIERIEGFPLRSTLEAIDRSVEVSGCGWIRSDMNRRTGRSIRVILALEALNVGDTPVKLNSSTRVVCLIDHPFSANLGYGSEFEFTGRMKGIKEATSPGAFDPGRYFYRSASAIAELNVRPGDRCEIGKNRRGNPLRHIAIRSRQWMEEALLHGVPPRDREFAGVILAMVLGAKEESPDDIEDLFRLSGTMHIFAVSGLHVGVVAGLFWLIAEWIGIPRRRAVFLIVPAVLFYALLTGLRPSSFRAAVMLSVFLAGFALKRRPSPLNGIGLAALILLAVDSQQLFLPGFQLSFCVVLVITLTYSFLRRWFHRPFAIDEFLPRARVRFWRRTTDDAIFLLAGAAAVSLASWVGSVPLMNSHFSGISPIGLIANIVMVPLASIIVIIAGASVAFFGIKLGFVTALLNNINLGLVSFLTWLAQFFAMAPGSHIHTGSELRVPVSDTVSLDVMGIRGESAILVRDGEKNWMIDSGGRNTFRGQVLPLLREAGINRIDCLLLSHGDSGHIGAAPYILNHLTPDLIIESSLPNRARVYPEIRDLVEKRRINRLFVEAGQRLRWNDKTHWEILYPDEQGPPTGVADDRCLVMQMRSGPWRIFVHLRFRRLGGKGIDQSRLESEIGSLDSGATFHDEIRVDRVCGKSRGQGHHFNERPFSTARKT